MATRLLVCLVLFAAASAVPLIRDDFDPDLPTYQCARQCGGSHKFNYQQDTTYVYKYKGSADTMVSGASEDKARMYIETLANIEVMSQCEFALRLQDVKVYHSEPHSDNMKPAENMYEFRRALTENTLRFSFDDGIIRDVCHPSHEKVWVLNFKKGLLSSFQNSMDDLEKDQKVKEIDVTGECQTEYTKRSEWIWERTIKLSKTKDLMACYQRSGIRTLIQMVPYRIESDIQSLPIMKSSHECDFVVSSSGILTSAVCQENHVFAPFSNHQSGGSTKVEQTLTFVTTKRGVETSQTNVEIRTNLLFKHLNGIDKVKNSKQVAEQKLKEICDQTRIDVRPETPRLFNEIAQAVKDMESSDLKDLYNMLKDKRLCRQNEKAMKFLLDSLPIAGTKPAVEIMAIVINNDEIPDIEKRVWFTSLSLIPEPSEDMLPSMLELLSGDYADQALLPVSSLLNTMCRKNVDCEQFKQFQRVVEKMNQNIDYSCSSNNKAQLLETLRAIGNVGYGKRFLTTLKTCLDSRYASLEVKVAAADAYRRFNCQDDEENGILMENLENKNSDSELRIISFLSLMRCPRDSMLEKISDLLEKEEDEQVGTFIYTHLESLKQTSDPHKQDIAKAVKRLKLRSFEDGGFKTSRSHEASTLINKLNLGYVANGDLIWSDTSMVPRALRINLTVEMFGNSINFFEAGARMDGLDRFVQKYFGTEGYFTQNKEMPEDLEAFIYARLFGNEVLFKQIKGTQEYEKVKSHLNFEKLLENLSQKYDLKYTHSKQLMDQSLIIPTVIGLPVNMTMNSSMTVDAETKGAVDFSGILSRSKPIIVTSDIAASAGLEVTGSMMVDAMLYKQGVRMRNTLHSSVNLKANLMIKQRQIVDFEIKSPEEKQEIFDARSQFFIVHDNFEKEQEMIKENRREIQGCTGDQFSKVTGIQLCGDLQYPNASLVEDAPYFPLTGPVKASVVMRKKDTQRSYKMFAKWIRNSKKLEAQLQLDTPGSQVDRHISTDVTIGIHKNPHVDVVLISPWKKVVLNGKAAKNQDIASLTGNVVVDDNKQYKLTSEVKMQESGQGIEFMPFVEIEYGRERIALLKGTVSYMKDILAKLEVQDLKKKVYTIQSQLINNSEEKKIDFSVGQKGGKPYRLRIGTTHNLPSRKSQNILMNPGILIELPKGQVLSWELYGNYQPKPMVLNGNLTFYTALINMEQPLTLDVDVTQKGNRYPVIAELKCPLVSAKLNGRLDVGKKSKKVDMKVQYKTDSIKDTITVTGKMQDKSKRTYSQYKMKGTMKFKSMPEYNTASTLEITSKKKTAAKLDIQFMDNQNNDRKKQSDIQATATFYSDIKKLTQVEIFADLKAKMPEKNVDIKVGFDHLHSLKKFDSELRLQLSPFVKNDISADISIQNKGKSLFDITALGDLEASGKNYNLKSELVQKSKRQIDGSVSVTIDQKEKHSLFAVYKKTNDRHDINGNVESPYFVNPLRLDVSANLKRPTDFFIRGTLNENYNELYSVDVLSKLEEDQAGKWNLELAHPTRKVKAQLDFTKVNDRLNTEALVNWDVNSEEKPVPEVRLTSRFTQKSESDSLLVKGNVKLNTPFKKFEKLSSNINFEKSESQLKSSGIINFDGTSKKIASRFSANLPISLDEAKVTLKVKTPFKNYESIDVELDHKLGSKIKTQFKAKVDNDISEIIIKGTEDDDGYSKRIHAQITMKTPYQSFRRTVMNVDHYYDGKKLKITAEINKDGEEYNADLQFTDDSQRSKTERNGQFTLSGPKRSTHASFTQKVQNRKTQVEASFSSAQKNMKNKYSLDINGFYRDLIHHGLDVDVKTPLKDAKKIGLQIGNEIGQKQLKSKIVFQMHRSKIGYDILLKNKQKDKSAEVNVYMSLVTVLESPLHLKSNLQFDKYPMTVSGQISWGPSSAIGFTCSCKAHTFDDSEVRMKVTLPFEGLKKIDLVASYFMKNTIRVSHLSIITDAQTVIDVEVKSQNEDERKSINVKIYMPSSRFQSLDTGVGFDIRKAIFSKANFELKLGSEQNYKATLSLKANGINGMKGKFTIKTPIKGLEKIEGNFVRGDSKMNRGTALTLTNGNEKLFDIKAETDVKRSSVLIKITTQGKLLSRILEAVDRLHLLPKMQNDRNGNEIQKLVVEVKTTEQDQSLQIDNTLTADFGTEQKKTFSATLRKKGEDLSNIDIHVSLSQNGRSMQVKLLSKLADDVQIQAMITDAFGDKHGLEYVHSSDSYKSEYKGKLYLHEVRQFESSVELFVSNTQRIELISTTKTNIKGYEFTKVKYIHDGQDNRISSSVSVENMKEVKASIDLVGQISPIHHFSIIVKTPFKGFKKLVISGDLDETQIEGLIEINEDKQLSLSGIHNNFKNPKFTLKTPLRQLQVLNVNVDGELFDGSSSFLLKFNDYDQIDAKVSVKYDLSSKVEFTAQLGSRIDQSENKMKYEMETTNEPKRNRILIAINDVNQIKYESEAESEFSFESKNQMHFEIKYPSLGIQTQGVVLHLVGSNQKSTGKIQLLGQSEKIIDADIEIDYKNEMKASLIVHQPKHMEYTFTRENFPRSNENELYFNWNRDDPEASLVIKATFKDESTSNKLDKSVSLRLSCPSRSVGVEHSVIATKSDVQCSGKLYWNDDEDSKLSYALQLEDTSDRRQTSYDGKLKIKVPTRTIGLAGKFMDKTDERQAESTFSWDIEKDSSKRVGLKAKYQKGSHTQADVSIILPKDAHVDSKLVMNKGNTILEGQTQIFYSSDSRKILTLFSKLENNHKPFGFFSVPENKYNYSIQLGVTHPESRVDVKMVSHLGLDSKRLTTSLGIDYMTSRKQIKNMDLFIEINRIKKEINLYAATPYKNIELKGAVRLNPMELSAITTLDNQKAMSARLLVDQNEKKVQLDNTYDDKELRHSAGFPNKTALLLLREKKESGRAERDIKVLIQLITPQLLQTDLQWRPGMLVELRDTVFNTVKQTTKNLKALSEEVASDVKTEVLAKYTDISTSVIDDIRQAVVSTEQEIGTIEDELNQIESNLRKDFEFCGVKIGDFDLEYEIVRLQQKIQKVVKNMNIAIKSYTQTQRETLRTWSEVLRVLKAIPADEVYETIIDKIGRMENKVFNTFLWDLLRMLHDVSPKLLEDVWNLIHDLVERQYDPQDFIDELNEAMEEFKIMKITSLIAKTSERNLQISSKLKIIIKKLSNFVSDHPYTQQVVDIVQEHANEFYQLAKWSINYLEIENNLPKHLENLLDYINEIVEGELKEQMGPVYRYIHNPVTQFDPKDGVLQAQFPLVVSFERLDKLPSIIEISKKVANHVEKKYGTNNSPMPNVTTEMPLDESDQRYLTRAPYYGNIIF